MMEPDPVCGMKLPSIENIESNEGPVSGPFILPETKSGSVTIMSGNVQSMPLGLENIIRMTEGLSPYPRDRKVCIGKLARQFDIVALQENFSGLPLEKEIPTRHDISDRSGISFSSRLPFKFEFHRAYKSLCSGYHDKKNDCIAEKGYSRTKIGDTTFVVTHLDAGRKTSDQRTRDLQTQKIEIPKTGKVVVMGDFNFKRGVEADEATLRKFLTTNNLELYARSEKGLDIIAGRGVKVNSVGKLEHDQITDHPILVANISLEHS